MLASQRPVLHVSHILFAGLRIFQCFQASKKLAQPNKVGEFWTILRQNGQKMPLVAADAKELVLHDIGFGA